MNFNETLRFIVDEAPRFISPQGLAVQWIAVFLSALLICVLPLRLAAPLRAVANGFRFVAAKPRYAMLLSAAFPVAVRLLLLPLDPVPIPSIHDEFSHLLLADTLAHGRLTNPTPAFWRHFQSIHIIVKPSYASMYPPGQGIFLAAGQILFHSPWAGVELAIGAMCAAAYWMFMGWLPRTWALFASLCLGATLGVTGFWVNGYMGGSVPAIGGALVVGAIPRIRRDLDPKIRTGVLLGTGAVILMYTRPFEGALLTTAALLLCLPGLLSQLRQEPKPLFGRLILPAAGVLALGMVFLGFYCLRVTGNATELPYQVNRATYGWPENLAFLPVQKVKLQDPVLRAMYELEIGRRRIRDKLPTFLDDLTTRLFDCWTYLIGPALTVPLVIALLVWTRESRQLLFLLSLICVLNLFQLVLYPYHLGPVIPILFCLVAYGAKFIYYSLAQIAPERALYSTFFLAVCLLLCITLREFGDQVGVAPSSYWERGFELQRDARADVVNWLQSQPGKHLVLVRYAPYHPVNQEWVYNGADLASSKILWARELNDKSDQALIRYYSDRQVWLVEADAYPQRVVPYRTRDQEPGSDEHCSACERSTDLAGRR